MEESQEQSELEVVEPKECEACRGSRIVIDLSDPVLAANPCSQCVNYDSPWSEREAAKSEADRISSACLPSGFAEALSFPVSHPEIRRWVEARLGGKFRKNLFLYGPPGVGKTHLATSIVGTFLKTGRTAFYLDATSYFADLRRRHQTHFGDRMREATVGKLDEIQRRLRFFDLLVIDNIGRTSTVTDFIVDQYTELIARRDEGGKATIYISNYGFDATRSLDRKTLATRAGTIAAGKIQSGVCVEIRGRFDHEQPEDVDFSMLHIRVRKLSPEDSTFLHIWSRLGVFRLLTTRDRARLTRPSEHDPSEVIEVPEAREFKTWGDLTIYQTGAVVDYYDANVLLAVLQLYHRDGTNGSVAFTLSDLASCLGFKNCGAGSVQRGLKRSLYRLTESKIRIVSPTEEKAVWIGGFIDGLQSSGSKTRAKVIARLNPFIIGQYAKSFYSVLNIPTLIGLRSLYAQGMYRFLIGQRDDYKFIGLPKWRLVLGTNDTTDDKEVRRNVRAAIAEMVERGLLTDQSHIDAADVVHTHLVRPT